MSNLFSDLANGKYKLKNNNTNSQNKQAADSGLFNDLANGKYKMKNSATSITNKSAKPTYSQLDITKFTKEKVGLDAPTLNKAVAQNKAAREEAERQEQERWDNLSLGEKIADPFKTAATNVTYGNLGIEENVAWNEYRNKQDEASLQAAQAATKAREEYEKNNDRIGKGNAVTKDFAQYLPQLGGQLKYGLGGAAGGAAVGAGTGAGLALVAGQLGPQVAVPEELATVPTAALAGAIRGGKGGYVAGTAKYGYDMMAGNAYKTLLDMGVPNDVALELSGDEALINSLIEGGGAIVDLISLGIGKLASKGGTTAAKEVAKNRLLAAAKAYGLNLVSEPLEEMAQEKVSIETEKKAAEQAGIQRMSSDWDDLERIKQAGEGALKVAAVSGGLNAGGNYIANNITENVNNNRQMKAQINQDIQNYKSESDYSKYISPSIPQNVNQVENVLRESPQNAETQQTNATLPTQAEVAQKANMEQIPRNVQLPTQKAEITLQSAKIAGANDINMNKAVELNNLLRSGAEVKFYNPQNIPQGVDANKAKVANGFYSNGTVWINKNTKNAVEVVLGHELTHHLETTDSYTDLANTILDSDVFYDYIAEKGYSNVAEYKQSLGQNYTAEQFDSEMVANFVQDKLFSDQNSIDRLARQNTTLVEKIKNWISDLVVTFKGTAQEKELRKIEGMYRKALEQARNTTTSTDTQYSIGGIKGMQNLQNAELINNYNTALQMKEHGASNENILNSTGWFQDRNGDWKFEFTDKYMKLKNNVEFVDNKTYRLNDILEHNLLFQAYPELADYKVEFEDLGDANGTFISPTKTILINPNKVKTVLDMEGTLIHEIQHIIQRMEGFEKGRSSKRSKLAYFESLGEIEANDTKSRFMQEKSGNFDRSRNAPETSKANPKHSGLEGYLKKRKIVDKLKDGVYQYFKGGSDSYEEEIGTDFREGMREELDYTKNSQQSSRMVDGRGGVKPNYETLEEAMVEDNNADLRMDDGRGLRGYVNDTAGKEPAFSMPEIPKGYTRLYRGLMDEYNKNYDRRKLDNINGYESWTDSYDLAKAYGDNVYYIDIPISEIKKDIIDENPKSETYGDRNLIYFNDKPVGIKGKSGKEYMLYTEHDNYPDIEYRKVEETDKVSFSMPETDNQGRKLSKEQQEFFKDSKVRDEDGKLLEVYHGTNADEFTIFDKELSDEDNVLGQGLYFTADKEQSKKYGTKIYSTYLNIKNPFVIDDLSTYSLANKIKELDFNADIIDYDYGVASTEKMTDYLIKNGYDGIKAGTDVYVAFEPNQIKNVDNTNPTENPDIRYSMNPVDIAKNPPNPQNDLDKLKRSSRENEGDKQSSFAKNILNQNIFDDKFKRLALDDKNIRTYESISNKETLQEANDAINEQGQKWVDRFLDKPNGEMKATDIAGGFILMNRYQQVGDYESMIRVAEKLRRAGTQQGQTIQLFSVLGRMTPEGMTYYAQKELTKAYDDILKNKTQKWADEHADDFKLNDKDIEFIQRRVNQAAKLPEGRDKYVLLGEIASRIQNKIPPEPGQSIKALARNSMLLNPKTMVRNILGNVVIVPSHIVSDFVGTGIDKAISKKTGVRTTGITDTKDMLKGAKKGLYESFDDFRRNISTREIAGDRFEIGGGKSFNENHTGRFATQKNALSKALNGVDRVTGYLLESGDRPFYEGWFINSLNNQMKLNNVAEPTAEMIEIATDEALQRTWQDNNTYTKSVNSVRKALNNFNIKGYGLGDMVMPFVKTPANLTKAVVDFSPLGAINAALKTSAFTKDIGKGVATSKQQREVVKAWSQVITGSLGMAIMTVLANSGALGGGSDEDKDVRSFEQNVLGVKPYSIKIGDKSYTYDWAQPLGTSAAMVADTVKSLKSATDTESKVGAVLKGLQSGASVLLEQSFVSGIRNLFEEDNLINALIETGFNEASKFTPQFLSQIAQLQDDTARTSYVYNDIPKTALNKVKAKIPGLRQTLEPSVDVLGREVKTDNSVGNVMFNPANTAFARSTKGAEEMYRVYQATGDKAAIAQVAPYYFNVGSEKIVLTPVQRTQYQKTIGKIASDGVENLLENKAYKALPDTDKAEILKELYSYGNAIAKEEVSRSYLLPGATKKIKESGMAPEEYILLKYISNSNGTKKDEMYKALISAGYSAKEAKKFLNDYKGYKFN